MVDLEKDQRRTSYLMKITQLISDKNGISNSQVTVQILYSSLAKCNFI